jgi:hypothetical protein
VQPGIPAGIRTRIKDRIVIPVDVRVNARGRVIKATAQGEGDATFRYLAGRATAAARLWRFSPARSKSGRAVAGSKTVYFVFGGA